VRWGGGKDISHLPVKQNRMGAIMEEAVSIEELLVSSFAQTDALAKLLNREGHHHAAGISREDFRRASDISGDVKADATLMQMNLAAAVELWRPSVQS